jgi:ubiquinone/menaquinone biosynthesis C-methylase UbiE
MDASSARDWVFDGDLGMRAGALRLMNHRNETDISTEEVFRIRAVYGERERTRPRTANPDQTNPGYQRLVRESHDRLEHMLRTRLNGRLSNCRVLDVGCGYGSLLGWFRELGVPAANLFGVDLIPDRIKVAREMFPAITFVEGNAEQFDFPDNCFDLVPVFTVFSSILDPLMARNVAQNISRVLTRDGAVIWYDMRYPNPWNPNLRAMTKRRIAELFPSFTLALEPISLLPPLARRLGRYTDQIYPLLASPPMLRSHYLGLLSPDRQVDPTSF